MTEYDYSPEAFEAYLHKQNKIAHWVDKTNRSPQCNPFTPATPAVQAALALREEAYEEERRHRRRESRDSRSKSERVRGDKESGSSSRHPPSSTSTRPHSKRHRSSSTSTTPPRPDHHRSRSIPQPLQLGPYQNGYMSSSQLSSPTYIQQHQYPRDSKHSSQTSSSTRIQSVSPTSRHQPPHSAPLPRPLRPQTTPPNYGGYPVAAAPNANATGYPNASTPYLNAPQFPHSYYTAPKQAPLIKRLFKSLTGGGNKQHKPPQRKRSMSF